MYTLLSSPSSSTKLGATLFHNKAGSTFRVWAPNASAVNVRLQPDVITPVVSLALAKESNGAYWSAYVGGAKAGHLYQFEVTNRGGDKFDPGGLPFLRTDPCARHVTSADPKLRAFVSDPTSFNFTAPFQTPAFHNLIM